MTFGGAGFIRVKCQYGRSHFLLEIKRVIMIKKILFIVIPVFGLSFIASGSVFAASDDIVYEITSSNYETTPYYLCSNVSSQSSTSCNDYKYLTISSTCSSDYPGNYFTFGYVAGGQNDSFNYKFNIYGSLSYQFSSLTSFQYSSSRLGSGFPSSECSVKAVLSKEASSIIPSGSLSITENGTYDVTNYASAFVNVDTVIETIEDPISNDFQKVFFAIVEKIIPAFGILLVVWFGIDMLSSLIFGRGR